jgi:hypothetical protein
MLTAEVLALTTRVDRHDHQPGFVEIDLVGHEGGDNNGDFASSLTVTDIATGWTEVRSVRNKAARHVFAALVEIQAALPFPLLGIDSDHGSEFINEHLLRWCASQQITFTRSRPANKTTPAMWNKRTETSPAAPSATGATTAPQRWALLNTAVETGSFSAASTHKCSSVYRCPS